MSKIELLKEKADKLGLIVLVNLRTYAAKAVLPSTLPQAEVDERGVYYTPETDWKNTPRAI
jgi:hypothetical protein